MNPDIENINNSVVVVQRHFNTLIDLHKINPSNKYILWSHDYLEKTFDNLSGNYSPSEINNYFSKYNIQIVSVSHFHKNNILSRLPNVNVTPIYNALFPEYFIKQTDNDINHFDIRYFKGLDWQAADTNNMEKMYLVAKEKFIKNKIQIINSTVGGKLEVFKRLPLYQALNN